MLAFACAFTMFAGAAFTDEADIQAKDAVNMLTALGVIEGYEDNSFQPDGVVTRAEMAKMIFVVRNNTIDDAAYENVTSNLTDITNHWAKGYIKFCESQGIIAGKGNGIFDPDAPVTGTEAAKMLLVLTGYSADKADLTGANWATNTLRYAGAAGILDDVNSGLASGLPRQYAAQMIYNTLEAWRVLWSADAEAFDYFLNGGAKETVGHAYMGLTRSVGTLVSVGKETLTLGNTVAAESDTDSQGNVEANFTKVGTDYSSLLGQKVKVLFKDGKTNDVLGVYALEDNTVYSTLMNKVEEDNGKIKFDDKSYSVENIAVYVDGALAANQNNATTAAHRVFTAANFDDTATLAAFVGDNSGNYLRNVANATSADEVLFIDSNDNGKIDTAIITTVDYGKATYVSADEVYVGSTNVPAAAATYKAEDDNISSDIEKNDYVVIKHNLYNDNLDLTKADEYTGVRITGFKDNDTNNTITTGDEILVDGTWYVVGVGASMNSVQNGNTVDMFAVNGVVVYAKRTTGENAAITDVAMVVAKGANIEGDKVKIATFDGDEQIVTIDTDAKTADGYVEQSSLKEGAVYEIEVKGDEYRFKTLNTASDYFSGTYTALNTGVDGNVTVDKNSSGNVRWNSATEVADTAKVFIINGYGNAATFDYKLITGKQLKSLTIGASANNILSNGGVTAFTSDVNGIAKVSYGVFEVNGISSSFSTNDNYGYITDTGYYAPSGYISYKLWTGTEEVTVVEKKNNTTGRTKGTVIGYSSIEEVDGENVISDVTNSIGLVDPATIYGSDSTDPSVISKITFNGTSELDITKDTKILFVDTKDHKGVVSGDINAADEVNGVKVANAMYAVSGTDVTVLVVDVKNNLHGAFAYVFGTGATAAAINDALSKGNVELNGTLPADTLTVGTGNTLTLSDGAAISGATSITTSGTGAVKVKGTVEIGASGELTLPATATLTTGAGFDVKAGGDLIGWETNKLGALQSTGAAYSVTCSDGSNVSDNLDITIKSDVTLAGSGATLGSSDNGSLTIPQGVTVEVASGTWLKLGGTVTVEGAIDVKSGASIAFRDDGEITFATGSDLDIDGGATKVVTNNTKVKIATGGNGSDIVSAIGGNTIAADGNWYTTSDYGTNWTVVS